MAKTAPKKTVKKGSIKLNELNQMLLARNSQTTMRQELINRLLSDQRDIDSECGYPLTLGIDDYQIIYDRQGLGTRVVKILPEECWAINPDVFETEEPDETEFERDWNALAKDFNVFSYLSRIDILSGIGRFGALLIGIDDGKDLAEPVEGIDPITGEAQDSPSEKKLLYLKPFGEKVVTVQSKETNVTSPRFGYPTMYSIVLEDATQEQATSNTISVHWSRILHICDNRETSDIYGIPRLQDVYNYLIDIKKILGGSGEMFWKGGFPGISYEVGNGGDTGATIEVDTDTVEEQIEKYQAGLQRYMILENITAKSLAPQVASPAEHLKANVQSIAMTKGIPYRILLGTEEAKLASTQDKSTWNTRVAKRQEDYVSPFVVRLFIDRMFDLGILNRIDEYFIEWEDLNSPTDMDKAEVALKKTEALAKYVQGDVDNLVPPEEFMLIFLEMKQEEVDQISKAAETYIIDAQAKVLEEEVHEDERSGKNADEEAQRQIAIAKQLEDDNKAANNDKT